MKLTIIIAVCLGFFAAEAQAIFCARCPYKTHSGQAFLDSQIENVINNAIEHDTKLSKDGYENHNILNRVYNITLSGERAIVPDSDDKAALEKFVQMQIDLGERGEGLSGAVHRRMNPNIEWAYRIRIIYKCLQNSSCQHFREAFNTHIDKIKTKCKEEYANQYKAQGKAVAELMVFLAIAHKAGISDEWYTRGRVY